MGALPLFCRWAAGLACRCWRCCLRRLRWRWASRCPPFCWRLQPQAFWAACCCAGCAAARMAKDADCGALWACILPVALITLYLLHTHVLHMVNGAYHTGQSCYGDMPMHLGFIKYIAQSGEFLPCYPLLGGEHRFGYPFLCETVSSVFLVLGAGLRTAYLLPMLPAFLSVYGMFWQLARRVTAAPPRRALRFTCSLWAAGSALCIFSAVLKSLQASSPGSTPHRQILWSKTSSGSTPSSICSSPSGQRCSAGACSFPPCTCCGSSAMRASAAFGHGWPCWRCPCRFCIPTVRWRWCFCALWAAYTLWRRVHGGRRFCPGWGWRRCAARRGWRRCAHRAGPKPGRSAHAAAATSTGSTARTTAR